MRLLKCIIIIICVLLTPAAFAALVQLTPHGIYDSTVAHRWVPTARKPQNWDTLNTTADNATFDSKLYWRLPTRTELLTLVSTTHDPKINPLFDLVEPARWACWTIDELTSGDDQLSDRAYIVYFGDGNISDTTKRSNHSTILIYKTNGLLDTNGVYLFSSSPDRLLGAL